MKDSKNVYELLNHIDIDLEDYDTEVLNDMEKQNLKNNFRKSRKSRFSFKKCDFNHWAFKPDKFRKKCLCGCGVKGLRDFLFYRGSSGHSKKH